MNAISVVIVPELSQLPRQIHRVPEEHSIQVLTPDRADQPFDKRMRDRSVRRAWGKPYHDRQRPQDCTTQANSLILRIRHPQHNCGSQRLRWAIATDDCATQAFPLALDVAPNAIIPMDELPPQKRPV